MPLFFCLAGLLLPRRLKNSSWGKFVRSLLLAIILPYTIWSVAFVLVQNTFPYAVNVRQTPERLLTIWRAPILHMWFLYALLFVQIAYFAVWRIFKVKGLMLLGCIFLIAILHRYTRSTATLGRHDGRHLRVHGHSADNTADGSNIEEVCHHGCGHSRCSVGWHFPVWRGLAGTRSCPCSRSFWYADGYCRVPRPAGSLRLATGPSGAIGVSVAGDLCIARNL